MLKSAAGSEGWWNAYTGEGLTRLYGHSEAIVSAAFSPDGQRIVTASNDKTARVFRVVTLDEIQRIVTLANVYKQPGIYGFREFAEAGGLMSYGLSYREYFKRVARYVDKVLQGAKPADLPVERSARIELAVNLGTAKSLGLTIPQSILIRADRVIE